MKLLKQISQEIEISDSTKVNQVSGIPDQNTVSGITPKALQLAKELNIDFSSIVGTGRNNLITREDIRNYLEGRRFQSEFKDDQIATTFQDSQENDSRCNFHHEILWKKVSEKLFKLQSQWIWMQVSLVRYHQHLKNTAHSR